MSSITQRSLINTRKMPSVKTSLTIENSLIQYEHHVGYERTN